MTLPLHRDMSVLALLVGPMDAFAAAGAPHASVPVTVTLSPNMRVFLCPRPLP